MNTISINPETQDRHATPPERNRAARRECPTCGQPYWLPVHIEPDESASVEDIRAKRCPAPGCKAMICDYCCDNDSARTCEACGAAVCLEHSTACPCGCRCSWCPGCLEAHHEELIEEEDPYAAVLLADRARAREGEYAARTEPAAAARAMVIAGMEEEE